VEVAHEASLQISLVESGADTAEEKHPSPFDEASDISEGDGCVALLGDLTICRLHHDSSSAPLLSPATLSSRIGQALVSLVSGVDLLVWVETSSI